MATAVDRPRRAKPKTRFAARPGFRLPAPVQVVGETIEQLKRANDGQVTPSAVVAVARPEDHPLHGGFEWDDPVAAELYREDQARNLIRSYEIVHVDSEGAETHTIANVCVTTAEGDRAYVSTSRAMSTDDLREQVVEEAERLLRGVVSRYRGIPGLRELLSEAMEKALA